MSRLSSIVSRHIFSLIALFSASHSFAASPQEELFAKVVAGANCKQTLNNGLICEYSAGKNLKLSIKDAGGSDPVIGFNHSDINDEFYAVMYFGCIVVVPGKANAKTYNKYDGAFIAPKNGQVYRTKEECQTANK